ncbi:MAG: hypothetical protein R3B09_35785 [Nannocystaceae bacterium]
MAMDQEEMVNFLFGALARAMKRRKAALVRQEAEARGVFDDEDEEDDDGLIALEHLRSQGRVADAPVQTPAASQSNDLIARARAELEELRQREELARLRAEIRKQREATAEAEALADVESLKELKRLRAEVTDQKARTEAAEVAASDVAEAATASKAEDPSSQPAPAGETEDPASEPAASETATAEGADDRVAAALAMEEVSLGADLESRETTALAVVERDDEGDGDDEPGKDEIDSDDDDDDDDDGEEEDDPVAAHPLIVGQQALRRGDARAALDLFTGVIEETRTAHRRRPKDVTIATGLCQSLRAAATARLSLADFPAAIRDASEAVDVAISLHAKSPSAEALTEVAGSLCDKVEVLLAVGDRQGASMIAGDGVRALKRGLRRHTSREALALFERLRSLRALLTRRQAG